MLTQCGSLSQAQIKISNIPRRKLQPRRYGTYEKYVRLPPARRAWIHADRAKGRKAIAAPLDAEATLVLREQQGKHRTRGFTYREHSVSKAGGKTWRAALKRVGIEDFRRHDLRHTWASLNVQAGTPLHTLQELVGWGSREMVRRYAHLSSDHLPRYADKLTQPRLESAVDTKPAQRGK